MLMIYFMSRLICSIKVACYTCYTKPWNQSGPGHAQRCLMTYANNKGADQPAYTRLPYRDDVLQYTIEPSRDKTNKVACAPSKDSDQPGHPPSLITSLCAQWVAKDPRFFHGVREDTDQTGRTPRLICVFAGRTCHYVDFVVRRLNWWHLMRKTSGFVNLKRWCSPRRSRGHLFDFLMHSLYFLFAIKTLRRMHCWSYNTTIGSYLRRHLMNTLYGLLHFYLR